jgi:hypothetical protein
VPKIIVPYRLKQELGSYNLIPLCDVRLHGPARSVTVEAVVDSGAVYSFFPMSAAEDAGIELKRGQPFTAIFGGSIDAKAKLVTVDFSIQDRRIRAGVVFVERLALGYALLGRYRVFSQFNEVSFLEKTLERRAELRF